MGELKIERFNTDAGNSITASIINGNVQPVEEIPTAVVQLADNKAKDYFPDKISKNELRKSILLKVNGQCYLVGDVARRVMGNDLHINGELHSKVKSNIPYIMWLATIAVYDAENNQTNEEDTEISIDYFSTMLPIFELQSAEKFSMVKEEMAERFIGEHSFEVLTTGCEKKITVKVERSKCYEESLVAKYAIQYKTNLDANPAATKFMGFRTILVDLGGGTIDVVLLGTALDKPKKRSDFKTITEAPFLGLIKELREGALRSYFKSARELETFIVRNFNNNSYIWEDSKTGETVDLSTIIQTALRNYTDEIISIVLNMYPTLEQGERYKYVYFGGVAPILSKYIIEALQKRYTENVVKEYHHIEPDHTSRFLNLYGLETISIQNTKVNAANN